MNNTIEFKGHVIDREKAVIFIVWLFHLSAIIGITIGFQEWFVSKTPLNLIVIFIAIVLSFPINDAKRLLLFGLCFTVGMTVEWLGVQYGFLFGDYHYGNNLGLRLDGVPWLIGINWGILTFITAIIAKSLSKNLLIRSVTGAALMVIMDIPMEGVAPLFDFWYFDLHPVPLSNYLGWFITSFGLHLVLQKAGIEGSKRVSYQVYLAQFIFFSYFYVFLSL